MSERDIEKWWDEASDYYQKEISGDDLRTMHYGPFGSSEKKLKLLGNVKGRKILELGCGGGQVSVSLAKKGALCTGIDVSEKQLSHARKLAKSNGVKVEFIKKSFSELEGHGSKNASAFPRNYFDIVVSVFALQYAEDINKVFSGVRKVLKKGGMFVFSLDHPFYMAIDPSTLKVSESYNITGIHKDKETWPDGSRHTFIMYRRRISDIVDAVFKSGLKLDRILEPFDPHDSVWGRGYRRRLVRMVTPTLIFKCIKT